MAKPTYEVATSRCRHCQFRTSARTRERATEYLYEHKVAAHAMADRALTMDEWPLSYKVALPRVAA